MYRFENPGKPGSEHGQSFLPIRRTLSGVTAPGYVTWDVFIRARYTSPLRPPPLQEGTLLPVRHVTHAAAGGWGPFSPKRPRADKRRGMQSQGWSLGSCVTGFERAVYKSSLDLCSVQNTHRHLSTLVHQPLTPRGSAIAFDCLGPFSRTKPQVYR